MITEPARVKPVSQALTVKLKTNVAMLNAVIMVHATQPLGNVNAETTVFQGTLVKLKICAAIKHAITKELVKLIPGYVSVMTAFQGTTVKLKICVVTSLVRIMELAIQLMVNVTARIVIQGLIAKL